MSGALRASRGRDPLGLHGALSDWLLPAVVAAMALLSAMALGAAQGAAALGARWQQGAAAALAVELPAGTDPAEAAARFAALPEVAAAAVVDAARLAALLEPWLATADLPGMPVLIELRLAVPPSPAALARIAGAVPEARITTQGAWVGRLLAWARTVEALALAALGLVAAVAAAVIAVAVRSALAARREQIAILHQLGATDAAIAGRFATRVASLAAAGAAGGVALAAPVLARMAALGAPLLGGAAGEPGHTDEPGLAWAALPLAGMLLLPALAAALGWGVAQASVRRWLWRLP